MPRPIEVLLVEDNPGDVRLAVEALKLAKVLNHLSVSHDGVDALAFLKREGPYVNAPRPDIILLDLNLPKMNGHQVLEEIKKDESLRRIPVVILSTSQDQDDIRKAYNLKANCYITKPVNFDEFMRVVRSIDDFWLSIVKIPGSPTPGSE